MGANSPFQTLAHLRRRNEQRAADGITAFSGTMTFVLLHMVWFGFWIIYNVTASHPFDRFPFGLLTLIVSLEAIFLSTFVLLSQNREAARQDLRSEIDFETNVLSEVWLEAVADKLGINVGRVYAVANDRVAEAKASEQAGQIGQSSATG
jgi:uncharacterized membrane protein